jgi:AcrR family transcriptional regulator
MEPKDRIISAACRLFCENGIRPVTMDWIAQEAGVSKRTIYEIFTDKIALLEASLQEIEKENSKKMESIKDIADNIIDAVYKLADFHVKTFHSVHPRFFQELERNYPTLWDAIIKSGHDRKLDEVRQLIQTGIREGILRDDLHIAIVSRVILELFRLAFTIELQRHNDIERKGIYESLIINYFRGIATDKGLELIRQYQNRY